MRVKDMTTIRLELRMFHDGNSIPERTVWQKDMPDATPPILLVKETSAGDRELHLFDVGDADPDGALWLTPWVSHERLDPKKDLVKFGFAEVGR